MNAGAVLMIAQRDLLKLLRDRARLVSELVFPMIFIGVLGSSLQANLGGAVGYDLLTFTFTGAVGMTIFQTTALGIVSLIEDRENDFSQEIFVSPVSRYAIVFGKILGETLVAAPVAIGIVAFAALLGVPLDGPRLAALAVTGLAAAFFGGAFGIVVLANLRSQRAANQVFPFIMLPQYFLAGIFNPIAVLPWYLDIVSRISPMRYAVDLMRGGYYAGSPEADRVVLADPMTNFAIMAAGFVVFMAVGTALFVRAERNR
ncbi:MAG TPA: ABC transporter permease [Candidatus Limnocylindria bacterium]|nr:ABC transporter permease [Candidatus Limnocylindria bacterium]